MISALTVPFAVTLFVNTVLAVLTLHPVGVDMFSLAVNVNTKFPLVHAACVILHVGFVLSTVVKLSHSSLVFRFHALSVNDHVCTTIFNTPFPVRLLNVRLYVYTHPFKES